MEIELIKGDITTVSVDAIVNAANSGLRGGGGVDGAIHQAGGPVIMDECHQIIARIGSLETGKAVMTTAGKLPCKKVIHTVGPVYVPGKHDLMVELLGNCYTSSLSLAEENDFLSIAFPCISAGVYGFPKEAAAECAVRTVRDYLATGSKLEKIMYVCFDEENYSHYLSLLP